MYKHTQRAGWLINVFVLGSSLVCIVWGIIDRVWIAVGMGLFLLSIYCLFSCLTVTVENSVIIIKFGPGLIRVKYPLMEVLQFRQVRNNPLYGWGVRLIPNGYLYNIAGLDAVELQMVDGTVRRIGTNEPEKLIKALETARNRGV